MKKFILCLFVFFIFVLFYVAIAENDNSISIDSVDNEIINSIPYGTNILSVLPVAEISLGDGDSSNKGEITNTIAYWTTNNIFNPPIEINKKIKIDIDVELNIDFKINGEKWFFNKKIDDNENFQLDLNTLTNISKPGYITLVDTQVVIIIDNVTNVITNAVNPNIFYLINE